MHDQFSRYRKASDRQPNVVVRTESTKRERGTTTKVQQGEGRLSLRTNERARKLIISDHALFHHRRNPTPLSQLTGKEELGDNGTRGGVYDVIRSQERYGSSSSPPQTPSADPSQLPKDDFMHETHHAEQPPVHPSSPSSHPPTSSK